MKYSLLLSTCNRADMLHRCMDSLKNIDFDDYEVIVVDQSDIEDDLFSSVYLDSNIKYFKLNNRGLSRNRNFGVRQSIGDYICIIDDDAIYPKDYLKNVDASVVSNSYPTILCGKIIDPDTNKAFAVSEDSDVGWENANKLCSSPGMVINRKFLIDNPFDERLGVGAEFGSGEESDIMFCALSKGMKIVFTNNYYVNHHVDNNNVLNDDKRLKSYAKGYGAMVYKMFHCYSKFWGFCYFVKATIINYIIGLLLFLSNKLKSREMRMGAHYRFIGFIQYRRELKEDDKNDY